MWGLAVALVGLWAARAAQAQVEVEAAPMPKRTAFTGYAAESARTATRLPSDERAAREFLRAAAQQARYESEAARLAPSRAQGLAVLSYASDLVEHHAAAETELLHLLQGRGMAPPMLENAQRKALNRLARLKGSKFDREFAGLVGKERRAGEIDAFEKAGLGASDPMLRAWIDRQLPALRQQQLDAARLGAPSPKLAGG